MTHAINWFEIPVADTDRAQVLYGKVLAGQLRRENFGGGVVAEFLCDDLATGGCLQACET
ncbi:MAG: hypothetical protein ABIW85_02900 [Variovorax sp.]